jgi:serine/threonine protein kinase
MVGNDAAEGDGPPSHDKAPQSTLLGMLAAEKACGERADAPIFAGEAPRTANALFDECEELIALTNSSERTFGEGAVIGLFRRWNEAMRRIGGAEPVPFPHWLEARHRTHPAYRSTGFFGVPGMGSPVETVNLENLRQEARRIQDWCQARTLGVGNAFVKRGDNLGDWVVERRLGSGGNGEVWRSTNSNGKSAALKVLHRKWHIPNDARYKRFRSECEIHSKLTGRAGILPLIEHHVPATPDKRNPARLVTEIATPLEHAIQGAKSLEQIVQAVAAIAETLASLHAEGISHRDIKPNNLFLLNDHWVIGDFGLTDFPEKDAITATGEKVGPAYYIAPEMLNDASRSDGCPADVYSLAKTLWVLAAGQKLPLPGHQPIAFINSTLSQSTGHSRATTLDLLIDKATRLDPSERPTMREVSDELHAWTHPTSVGTSIPPIKDIATRILSNSASVRSHGERLNEWREIAQRTITPIGSGLMRIAKIFAESGLGPGGVQHHNQIWAYKDQASQPAAERPIHEVGGCTEVPRSNDPSDKCRLACHAGVALFRDGRAVILGGFIVTSNRPTRLPRRLFWRESDPVPVGSALQDQAIAQLFSELQENLRTALEEFAESIERESA